MVYILLILAVSSIPRLRPPASWTGTDKFAHVIEYGILGILLRRAVRPDGWRGWLLAVSIAAAVGALDERFQATVPGRFPSVVDWVADLSGAAAGAWVQPFLRRGRGREPNIKEQRNG